jgi:hypothetical protein
MQLNLMGMAELMLHQWQQQMEEDWQYWLQKKREHDEERRGKERHREEE